MSITVTVPQDDAVALQAAADMLNTIARSRLVLTPVTVGCGCRTGLDAAADALEGVEYKTALGPITQHCLGLAKAANAEQEVQRVTLSEGWNTAPADPIADIQTFHATQVDPAVVFGTVNNGQEMTSMPSAAAPAPQALPPVDDPRVVPALSGTYTSPTGQLAGSAPLPPATLDKNGLPWDERINTSNKAQTQQGVWKRKPGLTDEAYAATIAELRTAQGASVAPPVTAETVTLQNVVEAAHAAGATVSVGLVPAPPAPVAAPPAPVAAPPAPVAAPPAPATDEQTPQTIAQLIPLVTQAINGGKITLEAVNAIIKDVTNGAIASMPILATRADLIPDVYTHLKNAWSMA